MSCPQNQRLPSDCIPIFWIPQAQTFIQFVAEPTCTGTGLSLVEPFPSVPAQLLPQAHRVRSFFKATLWMPTATCFQSFPGTEWIGVLRDCVVPSPNW